MLVQHKPLDDITLRTSLGVTIIQLEFPELKDSWPFLWYEYVVDTTTSFILAAKRGKCRDKARQLIDQPLAILA